MVIREIRVDYRSYIAGARDALHEAAKMFRLLDDQGHAWVCDEHKERLNAVLEALGENEGHHDY